MKMPSVDSRIIRLAARNGLPASTQHLKFREIGIGESGAFHPCERRVVNAIRLSIFV